MTVMVEVEDILHVLSHCHQARGFLLGLVDPNFVGHYFNPNLKVTEGMQLKLRRNDLVNFKCSRNGSLSLPRAETSVSWRDPDHGFNKLNTGGSRRENTGEASAGGLMRDFVGNCCRGFVSNLGRCSILAAEIWEREGLRGILWFMLWSRKSRDFLRWIGMSEFSMCIEKLISLQIGWQILPRAFLWERIRLLFRLWLAHDAVGTAYSRNVVA
ncbi:hypothetical protein GH714_039443 [Hevea brasiliensis]|uniref:Uncharacterized protein n=1 Tax=Hevea brasiliensis TaxID=3981 RepID=A0A6A6KNC7_HEVBR|nr:hypothetical protein GH714_039443 [Hevea brasiliensis]